MVAVFPKAKEGVNPEASRIEATVAVQCAAGFNTAVFRSLASDHAVELFQVIHLTLGNA
jgi:hypothetical protein